MKQLNTLTLIAILGSLSVGCSSNDRAAAEMAINGGLLKNAVCAEVPIQISKQSMNTEQTELAELLRSQQLASLGDVITYDKQGQTSQVKGYVFTQNAKNLVLRAAEIDRWGTRPPCLKSGHYTVNSIEAIEKATDLDGKPLASVRVTVKFNPEPWFLAAKRNPIYTVYWEALQHSEQQQFLYTLVKSGDAYFFTHMGVPLN